MQVDASGNAFKLEDAIKLCKAWRDEPVKKRGCTRSLHRVSYVLMGCMVSRDLAKQECRTRVAATVTVK